MQITKTVLPDGTAITIEGGDADSNIDFLRQRYGGGTGLAANDEQPLPLPGLTETPRAACLSETPLEVPSVV